MAKNDFSLLVKAKLDTSQIKSDLENIKGKFGTMKIKLEFDKLPNLTNEAGAVGNKAGKAYSDAFKKSMSEKIQFKLETGDFQTKLDMIKSKLESLGGSSDAAKKNIALLEGAFKTLSGDASIEDKIKAFQQFNALLPTIRNQLSQTSNEAKKNANAFKETAQAQLTMSKSATLSNNIQTWMNNNKKAAEQYGSKLRELQSQLRNNTDAGKLKEVSAEFQRIKSEASAAGLTVGKFGLQFKNAITMALGIGSVYQIISKVIQVTKEMVKQTIELEDAMAQLQIVTKATERDLSRYYKTSVNNAKEIGGNVIDLTKAATTFARLGYSLDESSTLAKFTGMLQSVGDIDVSTAENALTAIFKAYKDLDVHDIESIMDKLIEVGNNYPISVAELAEGINNAGSMLASAGNSYEETIAMLAAANTTVQDISKSSTGLRTIAARIRNTKTELDDLGEAMTEADYEALIKGLTKAGVALTDAQGNFRSTYDIVKDLSKVWKDLSNIDQAAIVKTLAGTRQQNVFFSLIEQFQEAENAMDSMSNSAGALSDAMAIFESTTTAHLNNLKTSFLALSQSIFNSEFTKGVIDFLRFALDALTALTNAIGTFGTVLLGVGIYEFIKNFD